MVNVVAGDAVWGASGTLYSWPRALASDGQSLDLDRVRPVQQNACRKFYVPPEQALGTAGLVHEGLGSELRLNWSPADLPYLGLWVDEGVYNTSPVAALEPCTGFYDSLDRAVRNGKVPVLEPGQEKSWTLRVNLTGRKSI